MRSRLLLILTALMVLTLNSCHTTKFVPEGKYLLDKTRVRVTDTRDVQADELRSYLRQRNNSEVLGFWKLQLDIWNLQKGDSAKWINRQLRKLGEPPEVFDESLADASMKQLKLAMNNKGYFASSVDTAMAFKGRKVRLKYLVTAGEPYHLRNYRVRLDQPDLFRIANRRSLITEGMVFDSNIFDEERQRITNIMRSHGYYYFDKELLQYIADSTYSPREIDMQLTLQDYIDELSDTLKQRIFTQYRIRHVTFSTNSNVAEENEQAPDTVESGDYSFLYYGRRLLREKTLKRQCAIRPGEMYDIRKVEKSYTNLNRLSAVKYVSIDFVPVGDSLLDCHVQVARAKIHNVTAEAEGTFSAGDWGVGAGVTYTNRNLFRGSEEFTISAKGSYEWRQNGSRAIEGKANASLRFPSNVKISLGYSYQNRPEEFSRTIANAAVSYYVLTNNNRWRHSFNLIDISYVYLPWISDRFRAEFLKPTNILKYSYEDHFIMDWAYSGTYSTYNSRQPLRSYSNLQYTIETAGNFLYGISNLFRLEKTTPDTETSSGYKADNPYYKLFNIRFAQYAKGDISYTYNWIFNKLNRLVFHAGLGIAVPFGNASVIPFEKRYFAGGANSVRGWTIRSLGPGSYRGTGDRIDFNNQSGDIKLDLNLEYRLKLIWALELALFTDAGNIWTIFNYETQPYGQFKFTEFYKQLAWSYGIGLRLNFDFLVLRVDFGVKLYDPSRINYDGRFDSETKFGGPWRTVSNGLCWKDDMTFHFAIGYPF